MTIQQISVFLENRPGALLSMIRALAEKGIDMRALSLAETSEFGIARILVRDVAAASAALGEAGYVHSATPVVAAAIQDTPGGLEQALTALNGAGVNVEYMYAFVGSGNSGAYMVFRVTEPEKAAAVLREQGVRLATQEELEAL